MTRSRRRGRPVIVGLPAGRRIASSLFVVLQRSGRTLPCRTNIAARSHRAATLIRRIEPEPFITRRGRRQQHSLKAPFACSRNRSPMRRHRLRGSGMHTSRCFCLLPGCTTSFPRKESRPPLTRREKGGPKAAPNSKAKIQKSTKPCSGGTRLTTPATPRNCCRCCR